MHFDKIRFPTLLQPNSESSNSPVNGKGEPDDDFDYGALIEEEEKPKEKKPRGRGRAPRVPATVSFNSSKCSQF